MEYRDIKEIVKDMGNSNIDELKIEFPDGTKISMKKNDSKVKINEDGKINLINNEIKSNNIVKEEKQMTENQEIVNLKYKQIKSPMVGTFYSKSAPNAKPFVKVGDKIKKGDVVCIIEAMKLMNEIESEFDGEVIEICKNDEDMCEYGECLFKLK